MNRSTVALAFILTAALATQAEQPNGASEELVTWTTEQDARAASGVRTCTVFKPGFTFSLVLVESKGRRLQGLFVGKNQYRDAYLRIDDNRSALKLERGRYVQPLRGDRLAPALARGRVLHIEWTDALRGVQQESSSLEGFGEAYRECAEAMGDGFR